MSESLVTLTIDGREVTVPKGTLIIDAAKMVGIEIPVFCYHPKLEPVGMCRMCLVEIGRPAWDRAKNEPILDQDGKPVIQFGPNLETSCTTPVGEGWVVRVNSERAIKERRQVLEFLLTSHPLDCPICDKGGECPLQNLTMAHGPGKSRFLFDEKIHLDKHVPLGDLIFLDRERCIQCARCTRFQERLVGEPVIGFTERGRKLEIVTFSTPGFDSYFSGNTTDICPVGALTTADFRFGARPWELNAAASICPHCPVGCNLTLNTRREARTGGREVIKRVMPRQNEAVNEIWICDKGRFAHHFTASPKRLERPLIRMKGKLKEVDWGEALAYAAKGLKAAIEKKEGNLLGIAGGRASNEDLFNLQRLLEGLGGRVALDERMAGGDLVQRVGVGSGTDLGKLGEGDAVLVIATDLHEEAPIWWLRVKQAADRGATLIVANARPTRLDKYASHILGYHYGKAVSSALGMLHAVTKRKDLAVYRGDDKIAAAAKALVEARNVVLFFGGEGLDFAGSSALAQACASLLAATEHTGRANNGLIAVWPRGNTQGAWDMGLRPEADGLGSALEGASALYVMAADPAGDDPEVAERIGKDIFIVVQDLFMTATANLADVVFPSQSFVEREGSYTNGERRVQRFYPAIPAVGESQPDWRIIARLAGELGIEMQASSAAEVMSNIAKALSDYSGVSYKTLSEVTSQWPPVGRDDLYFGGTSYRNDQGLGVQLSPAVERGEAFEIEWTAPPELLEGDGLLLVPGTRWYDRGTTVIPSELLHLRLPALQLALNPNDANRLGVSDGAQIEMRWNGRSERLPVRVERSVPEGAALLPRSLGVPVHAPTIVQIKSVE
jgi:NADH-quinone oxidoreductase subunit G